MTAGAYYIFNRKLLSDTYNKINNIFSQKYSNFRIAYSFKTNSYSSVCNMMLEKNSYAEVVSPQEYQLAKNVGFCTKDIIYNGVCKDKETVFECLCNGGKVNIDNEEDLNIVLECSKITGRIFDIGVRLNFDIGTSVKSRFGIKVETPLYEHVKMLDRNNKINVVGLHCHFTDAKEASTWKNRVEGLCRYSKDFEKIQYLDFGGNMYSMRVKNLMEEYAQIITGKVHDVFQDKMPQIIIETGTSMIQDCFDMVCNVTHIKDGFIFVDACIFDLGFSSFSEKYKLKINALSQNRKYLSNCKIVGYTCIENDVLKKSFCGEIGVGDQIVFTGCGSYSHSLANNFIKPPLPVVEKD